MGLGSREQAISWLATSGYKLPVDEVLDVLRRQGFNIIDSIVIVRNGLSVPLAEATQTVHRSPVWADVRETNEQVRADFERAMDAEVEDP